MQSNSTHAHNSSLANFWQVCRFKRGRQQQDAWDVVLGLGDMPRRVATGRQYN
jgi:hypothetical protein